MMNMKRMRKLYRSEHSTRGVCPLCNNNEAVRAKMKCCADGSVVVYSMAAPGLRAFARGEAAGRSDCIGKLVAIVGR